MLRRTTFLLLSITTCATLPCRATSLPGEDFQMGFFDWFWDLDPQAEATRRQTLRDLETIRSIFSVKYAPALWKNAYAGWDLDVAIDQAKNKISSLTKPTLKECQVIIRDFFNSARDYHVGVYFCATERASLPFKVLGAEGRYFVSDFRKGVDPDSLPFGIGDEIATFGGRRIDEVIQELRLKECGENRYQTDLRLAEGHLTARLGSSGHTVPRGNVRITGKRKADGQSFHCSMRWLYCPELIRDFSKLGDDKTSLFSGSDETKDLGPDVAHVLHRMMVPYFWNALSQIEELRDGPHDLGASRSFVPRLGQVVWNASDDNIFDAYIFETNSGRRVGYVRIPHYQFPSIGIEDFGNIINHFEEQTDALIIDQINNTGGSLLRCYSLSSMLSPNTLEVSPEHLTLTQKDILGSIQLLAFITDVQTTEEAQEVFGETFGGYPVDYDFVCSLRRHCHHKIDSWDRGELYTSLEHPLGIERLKPHPRGVYSQPILVLINSSAFSCGDLFPGILQDNGRATLLGTTTAGAGGSIALEEFDNCSGIKVFSLTQSLSKREGDRPIENLGVEPDIPYELTADDLQNNFRGYVAKILETVEEMLAKE